MQENTIGAGPVGMYRQRNPAVRQIWNKQRSKFLQFGLIKKLDCVGHVVLFLLLETEESIDDF